MQYSCAFSGIFPFKFTAFCLFDAQYLTRISFYFANTKYFICDQLRFHIEMTSPELLRFQSLFPFLKSFLLHERSDDVMPQFTGDCFVGFLDVFWLRHWINIDFILNHKILTKAHSVCRKFHKSFFMLMT